MRAHVAGTVQGVGFRPFVYRLAAELGLGGWVLNDGRGVRARGRGAAGGGRRAALPPALDEAPPLAAIESVRVEPAAPTGERGFRILESERGGPPEALVSPDFATCADCLAEVLDPADRRHRYPFTNCTNCGPRFSIVRGVPYDRPLTTMAGFEMCERCRAEYDDPLDRRFHAQPNACPDCGPRARLVDAEGAEFARRARRRRRRGRRGDARARAPILADQGDRRLPPRLRRRRRGGGGRAARAQAPRGQAVRADGGRPRGARALVELTAAEERAAGRPRAADRRRAPAGRAPTSRARWRRAPPTSGVMLPYSPLHHLLLADVGAPLVMTSGNVSDEPIAYLDDDARERLRPIADAFLVHDRPICMRTDDSVLRAVSPGLRAEPLMLRRSRGLRAGAASPCRSPPRAPVLGCGAELKSTFCLARGDRAWVGQHIGDLKNWETLSSFREGVEHFERLFGVEPEVVAHDLHPDYLSTGYAQEREGVELVAVQHHHAHLAACLAEHGEPGPAVGAIFDGSGYGPDGTVWGGELLVGDLGGYERAGFLFPVRLPGGDAAAQEPWRMACAWLATAFDDRTPTAAGTARARRSSAGAGRGSASWSRPASTAR